MKKRLLNVMICSVLFIVLCFGLVACGGNGGGSDNPPEPSHDSTKWFTEEELTSAGLSGLPAPTGLTGEMSTSDFWYNDGYSFRQPCPSTEVMSANAQTYLDYFKTHYNGYFGKTSIEKIGVGVDETWYFITQKDNLSDYFDDNPSDLYKFYYVKDTTLDSEGYFVQDGVWSLEIRYEPNGDEGYCLKLFIQKENTNHYGNFTFHYKMK